MNNEKAVLDAFERGKAFGFAEGMKSMRPVNSVLVPCDKLKEMQAEIEELKAKLKLHEAMDNQCASLMQQFRKASEK